MKSISIIILAKKSLLRKGDSAYGLAPWMMVLYMGNNLTDEETYFNKRHQTVRNVVERCIGVLKMRFRCLLGERQLRYHPTKASNIINACATLHNYLLCHKYNVELIENVHEFEDVAHRNEVVEPIAFQRNVAIALRNELKDLLLLQRT